MNILVIIPARGGSKGIPRKNLRSLNKKPLIYYSIYTALSSRFRPDVYVSSDDDEILMMAEKFGAGGHRRPDELGGDSVTLDPVILDAYQTLSRKNNKRYDFIVTIQPTSPLLRTASLDGAIELIAASGTTDTILSARKEAHLSWRHDGNKYVPNYKERVNRQFLEPYYVETGGFLICRSSTLEKTGKRIGGNVDLYVLSKGEEIDIDTHEDWNLCEYLLKRKKLLFVVTGNNEIGLGHVYRSLVLANSIVNHDIAFLLDRGSRLGHEKIASYNYDAYMQEKERLIDDIAQFSPDIIVNDILDTDGDYVRQLKKAGARVVNFEDLGEGARHADMVVNALYPEKEVLVNHYFGPDYFCARDEFIMSPTKTVSREVRSVLITFGGTDPNNLTRSVLDAIYDHCIRSSIEIQVVLGLGYEMTGTLAGFDRAAIQRDVKNISSFMHNADIIFTSAGRTVYEIACIGTPTIVMAQNAREMTHFFAYPGNGFINLGMGADVPKDEILRVFNGLAANFDERRHMNELMLERDLKKGKGRVISLINGLLEDTL